MIVIRPKQIRPIVSKISSVINQHTSLFFSFHFFSSYNVSRWPERKGENHKSNIFFKLDSDAENGSVIKFDFDVQIVIDRNK